MDVEGNYKMKKYTSLANTIRGVIGEKCESPMVAKDEDETKKKINDRFKRLKQEYQKKIIDNA